VPRRIREIMNVLGHAVWYMTAGYDKCIFLFPHDEWKRICAQVKRFSSMDARALDFRRIFYASVAEIRPDRQGRVPVPEHLRNYAGLDRDAVLIGVDDHMELWSRDNWRSFQGKLAPDFKQMATRLFTGVSDDTEPADSTEEGRANHGD